MDLWEFGLDVVKANYRMANIEKTIRVMNMILGVATMAIGAYLMIQVILKIKDFQPNTIPLVLLPFFFALLGVMVLSSQFEIEFLRVNCQFLNHKFGVFVFYIYLASLLGYFSQNGKVDSSVEYITAFMAFGYAALALLMSLLACFGADGANERADNLAKKLTAE